MPYKAKPLDTRTTETGCHEVVRRIATDGLGSPNVNRLVNGKPTCIRVYKLKWEEAHGPVPEGMMLARTCRNPACVNPAHRKLCRDHRERAHAQGRYPTPEQKAAARAARPQAKRRKNLHPLPLPEFRKARQRAGIPIQEMARRLPMDVGHLSRLERGINLWGFQREVGERYLAICAAGPLPDVTYPGEVSRKEAARRLGVSQTWLTLREKLGELPRTERGRYVYYQESDLAKLPSKQEGGRKGKDGRG
jgi:DNA-binding transcriptional regulator YiaG